MLDWILMQPTFSTGAGGEGMKASVDGRIEAAKRRVSQRHQPPSADRNA
jgi:hypothetical protein